MLLEDGDIWITEMVRKARDGCVVGAGRFDLLVCVGSGSSDLDAVIVLVQAVVTDDAVRPVFVLAMAEAPGRAVGRAAGGARGREGLGGGAATTGARGGPGGSHDDVVGLLVVGIAAGGAANGVGAELFGPVVDFPRAV